MGDPVLKNNNAEEDLWPLYEHTDAHAQTRTPNEEYNLTKFLCIKKKKVLKGEEM